MRALLVMALMAVAAQAVVYSDTSIYVRDAIVAEEAGSNMVFTATFMHDAPGVPSLFTTARVLWKTEDTGSASAGSDYTSITAGEFDLTSPVSGTTSTFSVPILNDNVQEGEESFNVRLSFAPGAAWEDIQLSLGARSKEAGVYTGVITDSEGATITISDVSALEGQDADFKFSVVMSHGFDADVAIGYSTENRVGNYYATSVAGDQQDYVATHGSLLFSKGTSGSAQTFSVQIHNDNLQEHVETFEVLIDYTTGLTDPTYRPFTMIGGDRAKATFVKELEHVTVCVPERSMAEGESDYMQFTVTLSHRVDTVIRITAATAAGNNVSPKIAATAKASLASDGQYLPNSQAYAVPRNSPLVSGNTLNVRIANDNVQSPHANNQDLDVYGRVNFGVEYSIAHDVWKGATGGAANDWQISNCGTDARTATTYGYIHDFEGATVSINDGGTFSEAVDPNNPSKWSFSVHLSHKVLSEGSARGAEFMFLDDNALASPLNSIANIQTRTPTSGCDSLSTANGITTADACWPVGTIPGVTKQYFEGVSGLVGSRVIAANFAAGPADEIIEGTETFKIGVALETNTRDGYRVSLDKSTAYGTITDDEVAAFTYTPNADQTLPEDASELSFTYKVKLSHMPGRDVTLKWETRDGTAVGGDDYVRNNPTTLTWPAGSAASTEHTISTKIKNDNIQELTETFAVLFYNARPANFFPNYQVKQFTASITDDEGLTVSINSMTKAQDESAMVWEFTTKLSHKVSTDVSIPWETRQASIPSAIMGQRFDFQTGTLKFDAMGSQDASLSIKVNNDDIQQGLVDTTVQTFNIHLKTLDVRLISKTSQSATDAEAVVMVSDNESPTIFISDVRAPETAGSFVFSVYTSHKITEDVTLSYETVDGTAVTTGTVAQGEFDFDPEVSTIVIPANQGKTGAALSVNIQNDDVQEFEETFNVHLINVSLPSASGYVISDDIGQGTITDVEFVTVEISDYTGYEMSYPTPMNMEWSFTVELSHRTSTPVNVSFDIVPHTALFGDASSTEAYDFTTADTKTSGFVDVGVTTVSTTGRINVTVVDDHIQELTETFSVRITGIHGAAQSYGITMGAHTTGVGSITDWEDATVAISDSGPQTKVSGHMFFTVALSHQVSVDTEIGYQTVAATALEQNGVTGDFFGQNMPHAVFAGSNAAGPYSSVAASQQIDIKLFNDNCQYMPGNRHFLVDLVSKPSYIEWSSNKEAQGLINDHDLINATLSISDSSSTEGVDMQFTVALSHCVGGSFDVQWSTLGVTAQNPNQFTTPAVGRSITFPALDKTSKTFPVTIQNDHVQGPDKTFEARIRVTPNPYQVSIATDKATGTIIDHEGVVVSITECISEKDTLPFKFTVSISHEVTEAISVNYTTVDGTAISIGPKPDYTPTAGTITFAANTLPGLNNHFVDVSVFEKNGTLRPHGDKNAAVRFDVDVTPASSSFSSLGITFPGGNTTDAVGKGAILGDNSTKITVPHIEASEADTFTFSATLFDEVNVDVVVGYKPVPKAGAAHPAIPTYDYDDHMLNFTFAKLSGQNQVVSFDVDVIDDWLQEHAEQFELEMVILEPAALAPYIDLTGATATAKIVDNDQTEISITGAAVNEAELGNARQDMVFEVHFSHYVYADISVALRTFPGTAMQVNDGDTSKDSLGLKDYMLTSGTVLFPGTQQVSQTPGPMQPFTVEINNDDVQELVETFKLEVTGITESIPVGTPALITQTPSSIFAIGEIPDDEGANVTVMDASAIEGAVMTFKVVMSHIVAPSAEFDYMTSDLTAIAGTNYDAATGNITFTSSSKEQEIKVQTIERDWLQGDTFFQLAVNSSSPVKKFPGTGTIIDSTTGTEVTISEPSVAETGAPFLVFDLVLSKNVDQTVVVEYVTRDGTALADQGVYNFVDSHDYVPTTGTVDLLSPVQPAQVSVQITEDHIQELEEHFFLDITLVSPSTYPIATNTGTGHITDNEDPTLYIRNAANFESVGTLRFTVKMSHTVQGDLEVSYETKDGSANAADPFHDYVSVTAGTFSIPSTNITLGNNIAPVAIVDDHVVEFLETFEMNILGITNAPLVDASVMRNALGRSRLRGVGTIIDNEAATIEVTQFVVPETAGVLNMAVTLSHGAQPSIGVSLETFDGFATDGTNAFGNKDYEKIVANIAFASVYNTAGNTETRQIIYPVTIFNDDIQEIPEDFCVAMDSITADGQRFTAIEFATSESYIELVDDVESPTVDIKDARNDEAVTTAEFHFTTTISHAVQYSDIHVAFATQDGTAVENVDYVPTQGQITFPKSIVGVPVVNPITVLALPDDIVEEVETFRVNVDFATPPEQMLGIQFHRDHAVGFIDDKPNFATISISDATAAETQGTMEFEVLLSHEISHDMSVTYHTTDGTAKQGTDYVSTFGNLVFLADQPADQVLTITVAITDDSIVQPDQTFTVEITKDETIATGVAIVDPALATGTITDDDTAQAVIEDAEAHEGGASGNVEFELMQFHAELSNQVGASCGFTWSTELPQGQDYINVQDEVAVFDPLTTHIDLSVNIVNDNIQEETETFQIFAQDFSFDVAGLENKVTWDKQTALGTILDDEHATVYIEDQVVPEAFSASGSSFRFGIFLSHQITMANEVEFSIGTGTATKDDFQVRTSSPVSFCTDCNVPTPTANIAFDIVDDQVSEVLHETIEISIEAVSTKLTVGGVGVATLSIIDDDDATISITSTSARETVGNMEFTVLLSHKVDVDVGFRWDTENFIGLNPPFVGHAYGTSTGYAEVVNDLVIQPDYVLALDAEGEFKAMGDSAYPLTVRIEDDTEQECDETFRVTLSQVHVDSTSASEYRVTLDAAEATGSLVDDQEDMTLSIEDVTGSEGLTVFQFTATLSHPMDRPAEVTWGAIAGEAGQRMVPTSDQKFVIAAHRDNRLIAGTAEERFQVGVVDDIIAQPTQKFTVAVKSFETISEPGEVSCTFAGDLSPTATGSIEDNELATLKVDDFGAAEDAPFAIKVTMSHDTQVDLDVSWDTDLDGTAVEADFDGARAGTLTFQANGGRNQPQTLTVEVSVDEMVELDETFTLHLDSADPPIISSLPQHAKVTIKNIDHGVISLAADPQSAEEVGTFTFSMTSSHKVDVSFEVDYQAASADVLDSTLKTVTFAGEAGETKLGTVDIVQDSIVEIDETFVVVMRMEELKGRSVKFAGDDNFFIGTISNDDVATISVADVIVLEDGSEVVFSVAINSKVDVDVTVDYTTVDGSGAESIDYEPTSGQLIFGAFQDPTSRRVPVPVIDNDECDGTKTFFLELSNIEAEGRQVHFPGDVNSFQASATILDDEGASLSVDSPRARAGTEMPFVFSMSRSCSYDVTVLLNSQDGTAVAGTNFVEVDDVSFTIPRNTLQGTLNVPTVDVVGTTVDLQFSLSIDGVSSSDITVDTASTTATITPGVQTVVSFEADTSSAVEGKMLTFTINLSEAVFTDTSFTFNVADGTADTTHYNPQDQGRVTIPAGFTSVIIDVETYNIPDVWSKPMTVLATLSDPSDDVGIDSTASSATGIITDALPNSLVVVDGTTSVTEGGILRVGVAPQLPVEGGLTVEFETFDGTAIEGVNYLNAIATHTFSGTETFFVEVQTEDTGAVERDLVLVLGVSDPWDAGVASDLPVQLYIHDTTETETIIPVAHACGGPFTRSGLNDDVTDLALYQSTTTANGDQFPIWSKKLSFAHCFLSTDESALTFSVVSSDPLVTLSSSDGVTFDIQSFSAGVATLTVTASNADGDSAQITVSVTTQQFADYTHLSDIAGEVQYLPIGGTYQQGISRVLNSNIAGCTPDASGTMAGSDCCEVLGSTVEVQMCQREVQATRQVRLEALRTSILVEAHGLSQVCFGDDARLSAASSSDCGYFSSAPEMAISAPVTTHAALTGSTLVFTPVQIHGGTGSYEAKAYILSGQNVISDLGVSSTSTGLVVTYDTTLTAGDVHVVLLVSDDFYTERVDMLISTYDDTCLIP